MLYSVAWAAPSTRTIGAGGDGPDFVWFLAWMPFALEHHLNPLFTTYMNTPRGVNLAWQTPAPLITLLASPLTVWAGPIVAYNVVVTVGVAVSAWTLMIVTARWVAKLWTAFLAGALFLISPYVGGQALEHPFLVAVPFIPLGMLWVDSAVVHGRQPALRAGLLLASVVVAEFYCSEETAVGLILVLALGLVCLWLTTRRRLRDRSRWLMLTAAIASTGVAICVMPYVLWQALGPVKVGVPIIPPTLDVARLSSFAIPGPITWLTVPRLQGLTEGRFYNVFDFGTYLGVPCLALMAYTTWRRWSDALIRTLAILLAAVMVLSLGATLHITGSNTHFPLPGWLLLHIPAFGQVLPVRLALFEDILAATLIAVGLDGVATEREWWGVPAAVLTAVAIAATWLPLFPYPATERHTPTFFRSHGFKQGATLFVVPFSQNVSTAEPMLWQAVADFRFRMVDGYFTRTSGLWPSGKPRAFYHGPALNYLTWDIWTLEHLGRAPVGLTRAELGFEPIGVWRGPLSRPSGRSQVIVDPRLRRFVGRYLTARRVEVVVLAPTPGRASLLRFFSDIFGFGPQRENGVVEWRVPHGGWGSARALGEEKLA